MIWQLPIYEIFRLWETCLRTGVTVENLKVAGNCEEQAA